MMRKKVYSDILPQFGVTACLPELGTSCLALPHPLLASWRANRPKEAQYDVLKRPTSPQKRTRQRGQAIRIITNHKADNRLT